MAGPGFFHQLAQVRIAKGALLEGAFTKRAEKTRFELAKVGSVEVVAIGHVTVSAHAHSRPEIFETRAAMRLCISTKAKIFMKAAL